MPDQSAKDHIYQTFSCNRILSHLPLVLILFCTQYNVLSGPSLFLSKNIRKVFTRNCQSYFHINMVAFSETIKPSILPNLNKNISMETL